MAPVSVGLAGSSRESVVSRRRGETPEHYDGGLVIFACLGLVELCGGSSEHYDGRAL